MIILILSVFLFPFIIYFLAWMIDGIDRYITGPVMKRIHDESDDSDDSLYKNVNIINLTVIKNGDIE